MRQLLTLGKTRSHTRKEIQSVCYEAHQEQCSKMDHNHTESVKVEAQLTWEEGEDERVKGETGGSRNGLES